ncbi:hypothetical protein E2C01_010626 [Portunus trituberculatus]|uniref:Uncharacterized protein n=1 Tax=Portunus trituberculatus TaxID=210409 RepID=A0A5B7D964_PORTR|nr:hypothetical protein [Portunus trituberculatus]
MARGVGRGEVVASEVLDGRSAFVSSSKDGEEEHLSEARDQRRENPSGLRGCLDTLCLSLIAAGEQQRNWSGWSERVREWKSQLRTCRLRCP